MKKYLFIVEKPSLLREIKKVYDNNKGLLDYIADFVFSTNPVSHISDKVRRVDINEGIWAKLELKNTKVPEDFYIVNTDVSIKQLEEIKNLISSGNYDFIVNAFDRGIYGQFSYESIKEKVGFSTPDKRLWLNTLTDKDILSGLQKFEDNGFALTKLLKEYEETGISC